MRTRFLGDAARGVAQPVAAVGGTVIVSSDWSDATGSSDNILMDSTTLHPWDAVGYGTKRLDVVSASGLGFPAGMSNVLRGISPAGTQNYTEVKKEFTELADGDTLYVRFYFRQSFTDAEGSVAWAGNHVVQTAPPGGTFTTDGSYQFKWGSESGGVFPLRWSFESTADTYYVGPGANFQSSPESLLKDTTYRIEWSLTRVSVSVATMHARIYNDAVSASTPLYDDSNISGYDYAGGGHSGTLASGYANAMPVTQNTWRVIELGPNGAGWSLTNTQYAYYGGFRAMKNGSWIGAYVPGEE